MKMLLIGASGCFGTELTNICNEKNLKVVSFPSKKLDVSNLKDLEKKIDYIKPTIVINSSAVVGKNQSEKD